MSKTTDVKEEELTEKYNLRSLTARDLGPVCKIISAIGIREFKESMSNVDLKDRKNLEAVGMSVMFDFAGVVIENIPKAEKHIQEFAASVTGMKLSEIQEMPFADYGELIFTIVTKDEFKDFFGRAVKLFKR